MSIKSAAYRLAVAVRDSRDNPDADPHLRAVLDEQVDIALRVVDEALRPVWDGSDPCRECRGKGSFVETSRAKHVTVTPCYPCGGTGKKGVQILGVAS